MKKFLLLFCAVLLMGVHTVNAEDIETDVALLQALDKTTGRTSFLTVKVDEPYTYGDLTVLVKRCLKRPPEETPENSVFLTVTENEGDEVFHGWMFSSDPALSAMDHPVYDIWVLACKDKAVDIVSPVTPMVELDATEEVDIENLED